LQPHEERDIVAIATIMVDLVVDYDSSEISNQAK